jgi:hypothetical protein
MDRVAATARDSFSVNRRERTSAVVKRRQDKTAAAGKTAAAVLSTTEFHQSTSHEAKSYL